MAATVSALLLGAGIARAQPISCFPTCDTSDGRFLALVGAGNQTLAGDAIAIHIAVDAGVVGVEFGIFDGDTSSVVGGHWDSGPSPANPSLPGTLPGIPLSFTLYADPLGDGVAGSGGTVVWGPVLGSAMPDNAWFDVVLAANHPDAMAPSGGHFYRLEIVNPNPAVNFRSSFKVRSRSLYMRPQAFSFEATLLTFNDFNTLYPAGFPGPTTYDGFWDFFIDVLPETDFVGAWDGDLDHGTLSCSDLDTDDPNTPNAPFLPPFAIGTAAVPEGVAKGAPSTSLLCPLVGPTRFATASPPDDFTNPVFVRTPSIVYEFLDPSLERYPNLNPSGNLEWERFLIDTDPGCVPGVTADYCVGGPLPVGTWNARVEGVDLSNLNAWRFDFNLLPVGCPPPCERPKVYLIGDRVWRDSSDDGIQDAGEPGIPGVVMEQLTQTGQVVARTVTGADGIYLFDVDAGTHVVRVAAENFSPPPPGGAVGDFVWLDLNGDGVQDPGEPGIPNVGVRLIDPGADGLPGGGDDELLVIGRTDANGLYLFGDLPPGDYFVRLNPDTLPAGLVASGDPDEAGTCVVCDGRSDLVTIFTNEQYLTLDFGFVPAGVGTSAVVGDFVWHDLDNDGIQDAGEPGISGVTVRLVEVGGDNAPGGGDDTVAGFATTVGGYYLFTGVAPGNYVVDVTDAGGVLAGYALTVGPESNPDPTAVFPVAAGDAILTKDFGYFNAGLHAVSDVVWFDADRDGILDGGESGLAGVTMKLTDSTRNFIAETTTDAAGNFSFGGLPDGDYLLVITDYNGVLDGLLPTTRGSLEGLHAVTIAGGDVAGINFGWVEEGALEGLRATTPSPTQTGAVPDNDPGNPDAPNLLTYDFGYVPGSVGDRVWFDSNGNGIQDPGEPGIDGVTVRLRDEDGNAVATTVTSTVGGVEGFYRFEEVPGGDYTVEVDPSTLPAGLTPTFDLDGVSTPNTADFRLGNGEDRDDVDFGYTAICGLTVEKTCQVVPEPAEFNCSDAKPLDVLTMIWNGGQTVDVKAWKGSVGSTLLATVNGVAPGAEVSVAGYAGSPNDVVWEIFASGGAKLSESTFHLSCSDSEMNGPEDCGKVQGDGKGKSGFINQWLLEGLAGSGLTLDCNPTPPAPAELCEITGAAIPSCATLGDPKTLTWQYTGGGCAASDNDQQPGKAECSESSPGIDGAQPATMKAKDNTTLTLDPGEEFTLSRRASEEIRLTQPGRFEFDKIHVSCSQPLQAGDVYGSLTLVALDGRRAGNEVVYGYSVANLGTPLAGVSLIDDKLGPVGGPIDLPTGASEHFEVSARIAETTINHVDASGIGVFGIVCAAEDDATVVVTEPCFECDGGTTDIVFAYLGAAPANVVIYDDRDPKAHEVLFSGPVLPGGTIAVTKRAGKDKLDSNISLWIDGVKNAELHTSCSQPIGPGQLVGAFRIEEARSKNNGLMCPLAVCEPRAAASLEIKDREVKWDLTNDGDLPLVIERITVTWPAANGKLDEVKRDGDTIHKGDFDSPSAVIASGWEGDRDKRTIKAGDTDTLKLKFKNDASRSGTYKIKVEFDQGCSVEIEQTGTGGPGGAFSCSKPIDRLTMLWDGSQSIRVKAWKGSVGSTLLADLPNVPAGGGAGSASEVTVAGFAGSPNDVVWEIFQAGTSNKLGESTFHLSCSDDDMDGAEDCGKRQGDGKGKSGFLNDWILEGLVDSDETLDCTP